MTVVVSSLGFEPSAGGYKLSAAVACDGATRRLSFAVSGDHPRLAGAEPNFDPFAAALLIPAMERGEDLAIEGEVDEILLDALRTSVQAAAGTVDRRWKRVRINAAARRETRQPDFSLGAATGMSCGIDSLTTFALHPDAEATPEQFRLKLLVHNDIGAHAAPLAHVRQFDNAKRFAAGAGLPLVGVAADLSPYYRSPFIKNHILRSAAAMLAIGHLFHTWHHSAGQSFSGAVSGGRFSGIGAVEAGVVPALSTRRRTFRVAGNHMSRVEKTGLVMDMAEAQRHLAVCIRGHDPGLRKINCGRCYKCAAFLLQAESEGKLEAFGDTFDLDGFRAGRSHAWFRLLRHTFGDRRLNYDRDLLAHLWRIGAAMPAWVAPFGRLAAGRRRYAPDKRPTAR